MAWFVIFLISLFGAIATMMSIWKVFQTSPTLTYLYIERESTAVDFPNVFVCFNVEHLNFSKLSLNFNMEKEILQQLYQWKGTHYDNDVRVKGLQKIYLEATPGCEETFTDCIFGCVLKDRRLLFNVGKLQKSNLWFQNREFELQLFIH